MDRDDEIRLAHAAARAAAESAVAALDRLILMDRVIRELQRIRPHLEDDMPNLSKRLLELLCEYERSLS